MTKKLKASEKKPKEKKRKSKKMDEEKSLKFAEKINKSVSLFQKDYHDIKKIIGPEALDYNNDKATIAILRSMLNMLVSLIPLAEQNYKQYSNERSAYAINALVSQTRELLTDIKNAQNTEQQIDYITNEIVSLHLKLILNNIINNVYVLKKEVKSKGKPKDIIKMLDAMIKDQGAFIIQIRKSVEDRLKEYMA
jgi:hypothetical protein